MEKWKLLTIKAGDKTQYVCKQYENLFVSKIHNTYIVYEDVKGYEPRITVMISGCARDVLLFVFAGSLFSNAHGLLL